MALEEIERADAERRQGERTDLQPSPTPPPCSKPSGTRTRAAKEMTFSEMLPLKVALEEIERADAERRMLAGKAKDAADEPCAKLTQGPATPDERKTRNVVAKALGKSATTLAKAQEVHDLAADPETPEPVREVPG